MLYFRNAWGSRKSNKTRPSQVPQPKPTCYFQKQVRRGTWLDQTRLQSCAPNSTTCVLVDKRMTTSPPPPFNIFRKFMFWWIRPSLSQCNPGRRKLHLSRVTSTHLTIQCWIHARSKSIHSGQKSNLIPRNLVAKLIAANVSSVHCWQSAVVKRKS